MIFKVLLILILLATPVCADDIVIIKYVDNIPALNKTIVRFLINKYDVKVLRGKDRDDDLFMEIRAKETRVLFYGRYK